MPVSVAAESLPSNDSTALPTIVVLPSPAPNPTPPAPTPTPTPTEVPAASTSPSPSPTTSPSPTPTPSLTTSPTPAPTLPVVSSVVDPVVDSTKQTATTTITNNVGSTATSGGAQVIDNHRAGDATTGTANATATIVNVVGHSSGIGGSATTFVKDVYNTPGSNEIQGNIIIDPSTLMPSMSSGDGTVTTNLFGTPASMDSLTNITNNVTLAATSGNADVLDNYKAGSATTGDATAMANIINVVNSSVGARNTFLGVVNIYGNLRGDILVPSSLVDSLLHGDSGNSSSGNGSLTSNINIENNIDLAATSGDATVQDNYKAGDATSGNAMTNLTVFNLTGQEVIAKNSLLVFVNVMGKWVGMIVNAPAGSTSAALTGGATSTGGLPDGDYTDSVNITNNVKVSATSGNATVQNNYKAGDATSGNASAGANVLNLVHSSFSLDDWFGILFINVLGSWLGNFGIAPDTSTPTPPTGSSAGTGGVQAVKVFRFNSSTRVKKASQPAYRDFDSGIVTTASTTPIDNGHVLGAHTQNNSLPQNIHHQDNTAAILMLTGLGLLLTLAFVLAKRHRAAQSATPVNG